MSDVLLPATLLFRLAIPCQYLAPSKGKHGQLTDKYLLPWPGELEGKKPYAKLWAAWNEHGLIFQLLVTGKGQRPWCRDSRIEDSDGLQLWIDTRNTQNIHRAGRFCHRMVYLPAGSGRNLDEPMCAMLAINRAKESPREIERDALKIDRQWKNDGYWLEAIIPASALTGYSPADQPAIGFMYAVVDRERGWQCFTLGPEFPIAEDPSLWSTLELTK
ncbi:hypothetical protein Psta_1576 [Pirellula staleyi DSM 6068]|uniref:Carbohydrate-binding domain-containing protein n=1 Tax=Pirellula staleyi (strain ATCC 27377 / DSM 6068 / ICPB 4128) TaxID=530564 RepID=D2QY37_PIRSD|nr:hypothetical protein [Pirellula staleyi]ADB16251.1 hypothetical protein Psta_1576 [Pirellula staleyi DSM 6068]